MMTKTWRWAWCGSLVLALGCTNATNPGHHDHEEEFQLVADPAPAFVPAITSVPLDLWFNPMALDVGDFNGDGNTDLLVTGVEMGVGVTAGIFIGNGAGNFAPAIDPGFTACSAFPVTGDLNGDGRTDVVTLGCSNDLAVYVGQPDGTLLPWSAWPEVEYTPVSSSIIRDFEGDGDADLITLRIPDSAYIDIALGNGGQGIWTVETTEVGNPDWSGFDPGGMVVGRFNNDDLLDAAIIEREHDTVTMMGTRPATFSFPVELGVDIPPWSNRVGDLDDDAYDDLVISSYTEPSVQVLIADGTGDFIPTYPVELYDFAPYDTALGDISGDGNIDVVMVDDQIDEVMWIAGVGDGRLGEAATFSLPSPAIRVHVARIDDDHIPDIVTATFEDDSITLVLSNT